MPHIKKHIELGVNIVIAVALIVVSLTIVKRQFFSEAGVATRQPNTFDGRKLNIEHIKWARTEEPSCSS